MSDLLYSPYTLGSTALKNRIVMAPMTRSRAIDNVPNALMVDYYAARADAGLLITEGTAPSRSGLGYARIPGAYSDAQRDGWKRVTDAVHARGGRIALQLMHVGRIGHPLNVPEGGTLVAPSAIVAAGQMYTDEQGPLDHPVPKAMDADDLQQARDEFVHASKLAIDAGFDFVELHGANGYLLDQFQNPRSNERTDAFGGSPDNRNRFVLDVARAVGEAIGFERLGIRLSPYGAFNDVGPFEGADAQYAALAKGLGGLGLAYIHVVDHSGMGAPPVPQSVKDGIRAAFGGTIILSGNYEPARAEADLAAGRGELVAFGRPFIANPDLVQRFKAGAPLAAPDPTTFYTPGAKGYTDYPTLGG